MPQIFPKSANAWSKASIFAVLGIVASLGWTIAVLQRSDFVTAANTFVDQPVQFSHQHHVAGIGFQDDSGKVLDLADLGVDSDQDARIGAVEASGRDQRLQSDAGREYPRGEVISEGVEKGLSLEPVTAYPSGVRTPWSRENGRVRHASSLPE